MYIALFKDPNCEGVRSRGVLVVGDVSGDDGLASRPKVALALRIGSVEATGASRVLSPAFTS